MIGRWKQQNLHIRSDGKSSLAGRLVPLWLPASAAAHSRRARPSGETLRPGAVSRPRQGVAERRHQLFSTAFDFIRQLGSGGVARIDETKSLFLHPGIG